MAATFADPSAAVEVFAPEGNVSQEIVAEELTGSVAAGGMSWASPTSTRATNLSPPGPHRLRGSSPAPGFLEGIGI